MDLKVNKLDFDPQWVGQATFYLKGHCKFINLYVNVKLSVCVKYRAIEETGSEGKAEWICELDVRWR